MNEYSSLFEKSGAENGLLSGVIAKQIFERARLPNEVLGRIWNLADTQGRGTLDTTEFAIAMHLLASYKSGAMRGVPQTLPPGLYEAAAKRAPVRTSTGSYPGAGLPPVPGIPPQFTGMSAVRPQSPIARQQVRTPLSAQSTGDGWAISPADKAKFDQIFNSLDTSNRGFITGDQAVDFFGNARLPEETLAQIWDLADINSEGRLTKDEFAVAMYLIRQQRGTKEGRGNLPTTLPPALVPPMMRKQQAPPSQPTAPAFENAPVTKPRSAADDLFGLDAFTSPPSQAPQSTGGSITDGPFQNPKSPAPAPPPTTSSLSPSTNFKPFVPSSSFGQSLAPQQTGVSTASFARAPQPSVSDDLLGDADPEVSQRLTSETSELANLSNQVGNLSKQMQEVQGTRASAQQELSQGSQQKKQFEVRLSQLRTMYGKEVEDVKSLQEQLSAQRNALKRLQQDTAMLEGGLQDLQSQRKQLTTALEGEMREKAVLNEKIKAANSELNELKPQVEKMKSEARQQKGLVAISKKQLATLDAERDRLQDDLSAAKGDLDAAKREAEEQARSPPQTSSVTSAADVAGPANSVMSATNPFFRRGTVTSESTSSPPIPNRRQTVDRDNAFDSMFGPSAGLPTISTPPPTFHFEPLILPGLPSASPPPSSNGQSPSGEAPAPPKSRQITSAALPFRAPIDRADSIGSSVQVAPPLSRVSPAGTPGAVSPSAPASSTYSQNDQSPAPGPNEFPRGGNEKSSPSPQFEQMTPTFATAEKPTANEQSSRRSSSQDIPGAFPQSETPRSEFPTVAAVAGLGATGLAVGGATAIVAAHASEEGKELEKKAENLDANFDQYFGGPAHSRSPSEKAADFDSAFANLKQPITNGTAGPSNNEFPPIEELDDVDTDDSSEAPTGFDDNFTPASPPRLDRGKERDMGKPEVASAVPVGLQARPILHTLPSTNSSLPAIEAQTSPPTYGESVTRDNPDQFPPEFQGLLPHRGDPTSPLNDPPHSVDNKTAEPVSRSSFQPYAPEAARSPPAADAVVAPVMAMPRERKVTEDDFDAAFANMAPAPVVDEDDEDGFDTNFASNNGTEFDPTFASPAPSRSTIATVPAPTATSSHFSATVEPNIPRDVRGSDEFYSFGSSVNDSHPPASLAQPAPASSFKDSDWDDMFAGLANPSISASSAAPPLNSPLTTTETILPPPGPPPSNTTAAAATSSSAKEEIFAPPPPTPPNKQDNNKPERPVPGRALTMGTEHDDPILKRLMAMGWSREESLKALEEYDYNIDEVSFVHSFSDCAIELQDLRVM